MRAGFSVCAMRAIERIGELTRPTGEEDLLKVRYPEPRVHVTVKQAVAAAGCVLALVLGWAVLRGGSAPGEEGVTEVEWEQVAAPTEQLGVVVVSVVGEVENPGLISLHEGARIADALHIARPFPHADTIVLNQAQLLVDGQQIHVQASGAPPPPQTNPPGMAAPGGGAGGAGGVSLNLATAQELTSLPGVGDATAAAIVAHRETHGPFGTVEELMDVKGIGPAKFEALRDLVVL